MRFKAVIQSLARGFQSHHIRRLHSVQFKPKYIQILPNNVFARQLSRDMSSALISRPVLMTSRFVVRILWAGATAFLAYTYYEFTQIKNWLTSCIHSAAEATTGLREDASDIASFVLHTLQSNVNTLMSWAGEMGLEDSSKADNSNLESTVNTNSQAYSLPPNYDVTDESTTDIEDLEFRKLTKKMIEVRNLLKQTENDVSMKLPSIVVIGSQSSGKSSVLERIVGREFLPKGKFMVTRRPLELTLVNCPSAKNDYAIIGENSEPIHDFYRLQDTLTKLNLSVPEEQCVSDEPIEVRIYSRNVPDLTLIDLPGYVQLSNRKQPPLLRQKIVDLCLKYIREDNIILAVCPADVDLANAEALRASRLVDPEGSRTIGVITKLDLVDSSLGAHLLCNGEYPLGLGYVGVVCSSETTLPSKVYGSLLESVIDKNGGQNAKDQKNSFGIDKMEKIKNDFGFGSLKNRMVSALEDRMSFALSRVLNRVNEELLEVKYALKSEFNDRIITPEGYASSVITSVRDAIGDVLQKYTRNLVHGDIKKILHSKLLDVSASIHNISGTIKENEVNSLTANFIEDNSLTGVEYGTNLTKKTGVITRTPENTFDLNRKVDAAVLTHCGIGRLSTSHLAKNIIRDLEMAIGATKISVHPEAMKNLLQRMDMLIQSRKGASIDQVENAIKPLKHDLEWTAQDWDNALVGALSLLNISLIEYSKKLNAIKQQIGPKRLLRVIEYLSRTADDNIGQRAPGKDFIRLADEAASISRKICYLKERLSSIPIECKSCKSGSNLLGNFLNHIFTEAEDLSALQNRCPEVFLYLVAEKIADIATPHVHHELVREFGAHHIHHERTIISSTDTRSDKISVNYTSESLVAFANENPIVSRHLKLLNRLAILETVQQRLMYLQSLKETS